jgi:hypothetical protein
MSYQISNSHHFGKNTRNQTIDKFTDYRNYNLRDKQIDTPNATTLLPNYKWSSQQPLCNNPRDLNNYNKINKKIDLQSIKNNYNKLINQSTLLNTKKNYYSQSPKENIQKKYITPKSINIGQIRPSMSRNKDIHNKTTVGNVPTYTAPIFKPIEDTLLNLNKKVYIGPDNDTYHHNLLKGPKLSKNQAVYDFEKNVRYTPEIGNKRQLSNIIYQSLTKKYQKLQQSNINEGDIHTIMEKYGLFKYQEDEHWDKSDLQNFVFELKKMMVSYKNTYKTPKKLVRDELFEKETKEIEYIISLDSKDRNIEKWPNPNEFRIEFAPISDGINNKFKNGYINRSFNNVISVQLVSAIFPKKSCDGDNLEDYPYLILELDELGSNYEGTNKHSNKAFAKITFDIDCGKYKRFNSENNGEFIKYFNPRRAISRLTLRVLKPVGELYNFGTDINNKKMRKIIKYREIKVKELKVPEKKILSKDKVQLSKKITPEITFTFKITCYKRALETMYLDRRDG